jgi:integrase
MVTIRTLVLDYLQMRAIDCRAGHIGAELFQCLNRVLGDFAAAYGSEPADTIRASHVRAWVLGHLKWRAAATQEQAVRCVKGLFAWADEDDRIPKDRVRRMKPFWGTPRPRDPMKPNEYATVMRFARSVSGRGTRKRSASRFRTALFFLHETGARTCEMRRADWSQLDWSTGMLVQPESKTSRKTGRKRQIPLGAVLVRLLRRIHRAAGYPGEGIIFVNGRGRPWDKLSFSKLFKKFAKMAGVYRRGLSPYCLRHSYCVAGLEAGLSTRAVADVLGHTTCRFVDWYGASTRGNATYLVNVADELRKHRKGEAS